MSRFAPPARYRPIVDDWEAFVAALRHPLPTCIWANPLRTTPEELAERLEARGLALRPVPWYDGAFLLPDSADSGSLLEHRAGLYHVQEEASLLPVALLQPRPGERVLDLCAAPGGKTAQLATALQNRGTVVANDRDAMRMRALGGTLDRLGIANVSTTLYDAANYPPEAGLFACVLADVPCSCEGTSRKHPGVLGASYEKNGAGLVGLQTAILRKAVQRCAPGGRIVYATCTYAPEENEQVVDTVLREHGGTLRLLPVRLPHLRAAPGLTAWKGQTFHPTMTRALRLWPHQNDTGGFFAALLEKEAEGPAGASPPALHTAAEVLDPAPWHHLLQERFGITPAAVGGYAFVRTNKKYVSLVARDHRPPERPAPHTVGMKALRTHMKYPKPTTRAAMLAGRAATRNVVDAGERQIRRFLARRTVRLTEEQATRCTGKGYVLMRHDDATFGVGFYRRRDGQPLVRSMYPKAWALPQTTLDLS